MLKHLYVKNFILIDEADLDLMRASACSPEKPARASRF